MLSRYLCSGFGRFLLHISMVKESSRTRSRAVKRLQPYNRSPSRRSRDERDAGDERGESSRASAHRHCRSRSYSRSLPVLRTGPKSFFRKKTTPSLNGFRASWRARNHTRISSLVQRIPSFVLPGTRGSTFSIEM